MTERVTIVLDSASIDRKAFYKIVDRHELEVISSRPLDNLSEAVEFVIMGDQDEIEEIMMESNIAWRFG